MNKLALFVSLIVIVILHYVVLTFHYEKKVHVVSQPKYQKVNLKLATLKIPTPVKKTEPLKQAKKKVEKPIKKKVNKTVKEVVKKAIKEKPIVKKTKEIKKPVKKTEVKKQLAQKEAIKSLDKFKKFKENYLSRLRAAIDRNKKYPIASKRVKEEGLSIVSFRILKSGLIQNIQLQQTSGKKRLDKAALKAVYKTSHYKPFDKDIKKKYMDLSVPIQFRIIK